MFKQKCELRQFVCLCPNSGGSGRETACVYKYQRMSLIPEIKSRDIFCFKDMNNLISNVGFLGKLKITPLYRCIMDTTLVTVYTKHLLF